MSVFYKVVVLVGYEVEVSMGRFSTLGWALWFHDDIVTAVPSDLGLGDSPTGTR